MGGGGLARGVPAHVDGVEDAAARLVERGGRHVDPGRRLAAVGQALGRRVGGPRQLLGDVARAEEDVERDVLGHERRQAVARPADGVQRRLEVGARRVHGQRDGPAPPLQQRLQVVQEGVVGVRRVRDRLPAVEGAVGAHVVVQHPEVAPLRHARLASAVEALDHFAQRLLALRHGLRVGRGRVDRYRTVRLSRRIRGAYATGCHGGERRLRGVGGAGGGRGRLLLLCGGQAAARHRLLHEVDAVARGGQVRARVQHHHHVQAHAQPQQPRPPGVHALCCAPLLTSGPAPTALRWEVQWQPESQTGSRPAAERFLLTLQVFCAHRV